MITITEGTTISFTLTAEHAPAKKPLRQLNDKEMKNTILTLGLLLIFSQVFTQKRVEKESSGWTAVYSHDEYGKPASGSIERLLDGLRKGYSIKIGWSWTRQIGDSTVTLEHFAEPIFLTIIQKKNVSAVINPHPLLKSYIDIGRQQFDNPKNIWQCVLTTQGTFNAIVYDQTTGELIRDWPQRQKMTWYLEYP